MVEATWSGGAPAIRWSMSAALENVPRGDTDVAEVTSLEQAVRAWLALDDAHQVEATLTPEHPIQTDAGSIAAFHGLAIRHLADILPDELGRQ